MTKENLNNLPPFLGGENPWLWLSPEGEAQTEKLSEEQIEQRKAVAQLVARVFGSSDGRELLAGMRRLVKSNVRFKAGLTMDQAAAVLIYNEAQTWLLDWIEQQIEKAREQ